MPEADVTAASGIDRYGRSGELLYIVLELPPERCVYGKSYRHDNGKDGEHDDERNESDVDRRADPCEDACDDIGCDHEYQQDEEYRPFAAVGRFVAGRERLHRILFLLEEEIVGKAPCDRKHDARYDHEHHGNEDGNDHQSGRDEKIAHVFAVLGVEDAQRRNNIALGQFDRQYVDGDRSSDVDVGNPDREQPQCDAADDRRRILHADFQCFGEGKSERYFVHTRLFLRVIIYAEFGCLGHLQLPQSRVQIDKTSVVTWFLPVFVRYSGRIFGLVDEY